MTENARFAPLGERGRRPRAHLTTFLLGGALPLNPQIPNSFCATIDSAQKGLRKPMNERTRRMFYRTAQATGTVARTTSKVALWTGAAVAGLWILGKAGEMAAQEEA